MSHVHEGTCYTCGAPATHGCDASGCDNRMCAKHTFAHVSYDVLRSQLPERQGERTDSTEAFTKGATQTFCAVHADWADAEDSH